ncbi:MAG: hypothetical protein HDR09_18140 [Lachnospiraceae bacterium]|nr:hypothetical protein [Lachnospiraceae bacterium]
MKHPLLILTLLLLAILPASADNKFGITPIKKIEANPINVAFILAQETDSTKIASICDYYGYQPSPDNSASSKTASAGLSSGETNTYRHPNGSILRISFRDATPDQPYPQIEVKSKQSSKDIDYTLTDLRFKKQGNGYERNIGEHARHITTCKSAPRGFLRLQHTRLPRKQ